MSDDANSVHITDTNSERNTKQLRNKSTGFLMKEAKRTSDKVDKDTNFDSKYDLGLLSLAKKMQSSEIGKRSHF